MQNNLSISSIVYMVLAAACWGFGTVITKAVLGHVSPLTLLAAQLTISVIFLWLLVFLTRTPWQLGANFWRLSLTGWLNPGLAYTFGLIGLAFTTASMSSLIWAAEPVFILLLARLFLGERLTGLQIVLAMVAGGGAIMVVGSGLATGSQVALWGNILVLTAVFCCAIYTVLSRRLVDEVNPLLLTAMQQSVSLLWAAFIWFIARKWIGESGTLSLPGSVWTWTAVSGLLYYGLAFWFYISGLKQMAASQAALFLNLIPTFGLMGAFLFIGEQLTRLQWWGAGFILTAVIAITRLSPRPNASPDSPAIEPTTSG
jgi:drug/metabolite transporter (DMT)-like permease